MISQTVDCPFGEGTIGGPLAEVQQAHPDTMIGSYPRYEDGNYSTQLVVRGRDQAAVDAAVADVRTIVEKAKVEN